MRKKERNLRSLDMRRTLLVTLPFAGALAFWQAYDGIIPLILRDTFHLGDTLAGAVMALDNVCALFLLPFFGSISDRCHSRLVSGGVINATSVCPRSRRCLAISLPTTVLS